MWPNLVACQPLPSPSLCTSQFSALQQERIYLLNALAANEEQKEDLKRRIDTERAKSDTPPLVEQDPDVKISRSRMRSAKTRLRYCRNRERSLIANLALVNNQMQSLENHQWRIARHNATQSQSVPFAALRENLSLSYFRPQIESIYGLVHDLQQMTLSSSSIPNNDQYLRSWSDYRSKSTPSQPYTPVLSPFRRLPKPVNINTSWETFGHNPDAQSEEFISAIELGSPVTKPGSTIPMIQGPTNLRYPIHTTQRAMSMSGADIAGQSLSKDTDGGEQCAKKAAHRRLSLTKSLHG